MRIYLLGYMGSGKSTTGRKLATRLGYDFLDLDEVFHQKYHESVADHFRKYGEASFREMEALLLNETPELQDVVISCGGGTPCFFDNLALMKKSGITVYLKMSPESLLNRLQNAKHPRPLLQQIPEDDKLAFIKKQLSEREVFYNQAAISVKGESLDMNALVEKIRALDK